MLIRSKRHWATLLAVGLPLIVGGCAGGMGTPHGGPTAPPEATKTSRMDALALADQLKAEGNFSSAASMYQQAAQANPSDVRPLLGLGDSFLAVGSNANAAQAYSAALSIQPNNLDALRGLGHARILLGQPQFALTQYQTALKMAPNDIRVLNGLGVAQDMVGDHAGAQKSYHQVLTLDPANQSAKNNLALSMALAGDDAGAIKILEDVSKSSTATATNRQNLALLYGVSGQMAEAEQASRGDLPADVVNRNMAAMSNNGDAAKRQELLKQSLGVELKGRQYAAAAQPATPLTTLAQTSSIQDDQPVYMSSQEGAAMPVITTGEAAKTQTAQSTDVVVKTTGKKDAWSDWDEELVDATDVNGTTGTQTAAAPAQSTTSNITDTTAVVDGSGAPVQASQDAGKPRFLSSSAIADDKPATAAATTASKPAASSEPAASSSTTTATQTAAVPPTATTTADAAKQPAATSTAAVEKPAASTATTSVATSTAAPAGTATTASTTASTPSGGNDAASSMTVTAKTMDVAKVYTVQIASYRSEQEASTGWQALTAEQADLLAKLPHAVAKADLGADKGIYYRLQAGSFSDRNAAKALCADLKDHSIDCMVVEATPATAAPTSSQQSMLDSDNSFVIGAR